MSDSPDLSDLEKIALTIAAEAPFEFSQYGYLTNISRESITALREELLRRGLDWRVLKTRMVEARRAQRVSARRAAP